MRFFNFLKKIISKRPKLSVLILVVIIALIVIPRLGSSGKNGTFKVQAGDFVKRVSVVGAVIPAQDAELSFDSSGRVANINKKVGDTVGVGAILASLSSADIQADLLKARADLEAEQAKLSELKTFGNGSTKVLNAKKEMSDALYDAYTNADDAVRNHADQLFRNPQGRADFLFSPRDSDIKKKIDDERNDLEYMFKRWNVWVQKLTLDNYTDEQITETQNNLIRVRNFLDQIASVANDSRTGVNMSTDDLIRYRTAVSDARAQINTSVSALTTAKENIRSINSEIPYQEAKVRSAEAVVRNYEAQLAKASIFAPFSGVITKIDIEKGESVSANMPVVSMISASNFQIETYVPEVNIKDLKIGDEATVVLDAFGDSASFVAKVIAIDPAETVRDGVSTYKTKFEFVQNDSRLKSGMTANVKITTEKRSGVISVLPTSVYRKGEFSFVKVKVGNQSVEKQITVGAFDETGRIEVLSGLSTGEEVYTNPNGN